MSALKDTPRLDGDRTTADLRFCGEQFESIRSDITDLAAGLDAMQLGWQPNVSTWSIAQCIEHLSVATEHDLGRLNALIAIAAAARRLRLGPLPHSPRRSPTISLHEAPRQSIAAVALARTAPPEADPHHCVERFLDLNGRLLAVIERAAALAATIPSNHSAVSLLDLVGHALQLNALHHWRLILQARRLTERPAFPHH